MWQWIAKIAAAKMVDKLAKSDKGSSDRSTMGSEIAAALIKESQANSKPVAPIWTGAPGSEKPPDRAKAPGVPVTKPAGEIQGSFDIEKWAAEPSGTAKQKLGEYVGKGIINAYRNQ